MALIIAGDRSGVGKTTITIAILAYLRAKNHQTQSFKVGPDYIDPMFHTAVTGIVCRNLDPVLTSPSYIQKSFQRYSQHVDSVVIEGVMGLFDGVCNPDINNGLNDYGSTAHIARILELPVVLVLDCSRLSSSIAAIAFGYANLDPEVNIAGVILNKVASDRHLELLQGALNTISMPILGVLRRDEAIRLQDRHLGLVPSTELPEIRRTFTQLANVAQESLNWEKLLPLIQQIPTRTPDRLSGVKQLSASTIKLAVARDKAFSFYYQDNLDILTELGAELIFWSPLEDPQVPEGIQGMYFGGGFPEVFAQQLAGNHDVLKQLKQMILAGIPTYAECGGLMYLCQKLIDLEEQSWSMVGIIPSSVTMKAKLTLGYRQAIALQDSSLVKIQQTIRGHEFHHSQLNIASITPQWQLQGLHKSSPKLTEGWNISSLHASYLHLHWGECKHLVQRFIDRCRNFET